MPEDPETTACARSTTGAQPQKHTVLNMNNWDLQLWTHNLASQRGPPARTIAQGTVARDPPYLHPSLPPSLWRTSDPHTVCCWSVSACLGLPRQLLTLLPCHWPEAPLFQMFPTEPRSSQTLSISLYKRKISCSHIS